MEITDKNYNYITYFYKAFTYLLTLFAPTVYLWNSQYIFSILQKLNRELSRKVEWIGQSIFPSVHSLSPKKSNFPLVDSPE